MSRVQIVVPCYNEEHRLDRGTFVDFVRHNPTASILFVNDGSLDQTESILREVCSVVPDSLQWMSLSRNRGKAEAVRQGMRRALAGGAELVGYWDADLATPLAAVTDFLRVMDRDPHLLVCMGARAQLLGRQITRSARRHYLGRMFATVASVVLRLPVYDTQCGAKLFRNDSLIRNVFADPFLSKWIFDVELLARLETLIGPPELEKRTYEVALRQWQDIRGSKLGPRDYLVAIRDMWRIWRTQPRDGSGAPRTCKD